MPVNSRKLDTSKLRTKPALAEVMKKAGVMDQPTVFLLEEIETGAT